MTTPIARLSLDLDAEQRLVAEAPSEARLVVLAGAGRGKSEVVGRRVAYLVDEAELNPSDEILVLSFSRAAVDTIRQRLEGGEHSATVVRTFDSYASQLLLEVIGDELPNGFDARIAEATKQLLNGDVPVGVEALRHVIIDEVQDLVGVRADFVMSLLASLDDDAGFTALGDPLQGIFDFQLRKDDSRTSAWLRRRLVEDLGAREHLLVNDYRAVGRDAKRIVHAGDELRTRSDDVMTSSDLLLLDSAALDLLDIGEATRASNVVDGLRGTTAVLTTTNAAALLMSRVLADAGIIHNVRRPAQEIGARTWLAELFQDVNVLDLDRQRFDSLAASQPRVALTDNAWSLLRSAAPRRQSGSRMVSLPALRSVVRSGALPWQMLSDGASKVTVSTVHRAKGLEFDNVIVVGESRPGATSSYSERVKTRYVALSRARSQIFEATLAASMLRSAGFGRTRSDRWAECDWQNKSKVPRTLEFRPVDVETRRPFDTREQSSAEVQYQLAQEDVVGREVTARLLPRDSYDSAPVYALLLDDLHQIGQTTPEFGDDLTQDFGSRSRVKPPGRLDGLIITAVESTAGDPELTVQAGLGRGGFWLVPRILGFAQPDWRAGAL